jgi:hypothetical protein
VKACSAGDLVFHGQAPLDGGLEYRQRGVQRRRIAFQVIAQPLGYRERPLAHRRARDDMAGQVRSRLDNAARGVTKGNPFGAGWA